MKKKNKVQDEAQLLRTAHQEASEALAQALQEQQKAQQEIAALQDEVATLRLGGEATQATQKQQLEAYSQEVSDLKGQLHEKTTSLLKLEETVQELNQENARLSHCEEQLTALQERERLQCSALEEKSSVVEELKKIQAKYEEEKYSNAELRTTIGNLESEVQKLKLSEEGLRKLYNQSEEKRKVSEETAGHLEEQGVNLSQEVTALRQAVSDAQTFHESSQEKDSLQEKLNLTEAAKSLIEQELQKCRQSLEDAKAGMEILESELQAKAQELTMSNTTITELEVKVKQAEGDLTDEMEELKKTLAHHNEEVREKEYCVVMSCESCDLLDFYCKSNGTFTSLCHSLQCSVLCLLHKLVP